MGIIYNSAIWGLTTPWITAVVGMKGRDTNQVQAQVVDTTDKETLQDFVFGNTTPDTVVYTDETRAYSDLPRSHATVNR